MGERAENVLQLGQVACDASHSLTWPPNLGPITKGGEPTLPKSPAELLQGLVEHTQLLACLHWLCEFQILAYVPLSERVAYTDLADLTGVSAAQIRRIVRTTAVAGFLCEPHPDHVAHTPISTQFVKRPSFLDALMFIAETVAPAALHMAGASRRATCYRKQRQQQQEKEKEKETRPSVSAFQMATKSSSISLATACEKDAKLKRRASAFQRLTATSKATAVTHILSLMDWEGLGHATVVEVNAASIATAKALSAQNPELRFVVQMPRDDIPSASTDSCALRTTSTTTTTAAAITTTQRRTASVNPVVIQQRPPGAPQNERNAAVYLLHMPDPFFCTSSEAHAAVCTAELRTHFELLAANGKGILLLIVDVLPESGGHIPKSNPNQCADVMARLQDLLLLQMGHEEVLDTGRFAALLKGVDATKRLKMVNQLSSPDYPLVAYKLCALPLSI